MKAKEHLDGATLGVAINGQTFHITRLRSQSEDTFFSWSNQGTLTSKSNTDALEGKYRLIRKDNVLFLLFDIGKGWQELAWVNVPTAQAQVYLANGSVNASQTFTTYFDNFQVNSGLTTYRP